MGRPRPIKTTDEGPAYINEYFAAHPEMMLGQPTLEHGQYGREFAIVRTLRNLQALRRALTGTLRRLQPRSANAPKVY